MSAKVDFETERFSGSNETRKKRGFKLKKFWLLLYVIFSRRLRTNTRPYVYKIKRINPFEQANFQMEN